MQRKQVVTSLGIILVAVNMRLPITAIPPIMAQLQQATGLSATMAGLLTSIPLLTFAVVSTAFTKLSRRFGHVPVLLTAFLILTGGSLLRIMPQVAPLLLGTLLIGLGIDGGNVILPAIIKDRLPERPTFGVSLYTTSMVLMSSLATGAVGLLTQRFSLRTTMIGLAGLSLVSVLGCLLLMQPRAVQTAREAQTVKLPQSVWTDRLAWLITLFFGIQALLYYSLVTWLPNMFETAGYSAVTAAMLVTLLQLACLVCAFVTPWFAKSTNGKRWLLWVIGVGFTLAPLGILWPSHALWYGVTLTLLMGVASGFSFNLAVIFFTQKTRNPAETVEVSGMAQTLGYLLAAGGPFSFGLLKSSGGNWTSTLIICGVFGALITLVGILIERRQHIFSR